MFLGYERTKCEKSISIILEFKLLANARAVFGPSQKDNFDRDPQFMIEY